MTPFILYSIKQPAIRFQLKLRLSLRKSTVVKSRFSRKSKLNVRDLKESAKCKLTPKSWLSVANLRCRYQSQLLTLHTSNTIRLGQSPFSHHRRSFSMIMKLSRVTIKLIRPLTLTILSRTMRVMEESMKLRRRKCHRGKVIGKH